MIHWLWLVPALLIGSGAGLFIAALCVASRNDGGCICECEAVCSKQADGV